MGSFKYALLLVSICAGLAAGSFQFSSNFSASVIHANGWQFCAVEMSEFSIPFLWLGANFRSADISGNLNSGSVDVVTGSAYVAISGFPFSFLSYFKSNYNLDIGAGQNFANANVSASAGYVGTAYLRLEEASPNGTIVAIRSLEWITNIATDAGLSYSVTETSTAGGSTVQFVTYTGTSNAADNLVVKASFLVSSVAGILNESIPIVPKSLESVISITGYPYQSAQNSLSLVMGVGTGGASVTASGKTILSQGNSVYFSLSDNAVVGGTVQAVKISTFSTGNVDVDVGNTAFSSQLSGRYGASASLKIVKVTFPAGASSITYDPSMGTGTSAQEGSSPASTTLASLAFIFIALLLVVM